MSKVRNWVREIWNKYEKKISKIESDLLQLEEKKLGPLSSIEQEAKDKQR